MWSIFWHATVIMDKCSYDNKDNLKMHLLVKSWNVNQSRNIPGSCKYYLKRCSRWRYYDKSINISPYNWSRSDHVHFRFWVFLYKYWHNINLKIYHTSTPFSLQCRLKWHRVLLGYTPNAIKYKKAIIPFLGKDDLHSISFFQFCNFTALKSTLRNTFSQHTLQQKILPCIPPFTQSLHSEIYFFMPKAFTPSSSKVYL